MTEIEKQALAHINTVRTEFGLEPMRRLNRTDYVTDEVVYRILKQFDQHKRDVSEAIGKIRLVFPESYRRHGAELFDRFILPKPDPLVEALNEAFPVSFADAPMLPGDTDEFRKALAARGLKIVEAE